MAAKPGSLGWLVLADTFDSPQCREGVIVGLKDEWCQLLVRAKRPSEATGHFTTLEHDGKVFFLVEIPCHLLRALSSGITFEAGCGNRRVDEVGKRTDRVRLRADHRFCNRRKGSANGRSSTASSEGTKPEQFGKLRQRSRRHNHLER